MCIRDRIQVIFIFYFLLPKVFEFQSDTYWGPLFSSVVTFAIFEAAFFSEIVRSGIQSISKGQVHAGYALGFTYGQSMRTWYYLKPSVTCSQYC